METQKNWLKFVISGRVEDYLKYVSSCKKENISEDSKNAFYNRCVGYQGNEGSRK